ncbi:type I glyceraldehyde-3-phosphate dehydrogenase [Patescibacteria group bacterium]|nr:type I glyceraldehyde-3-phosphate dehydrogenase [Patescibacteria group bacterium]
MIRIAINGYGRIGRLAHRVILEKFYDRVEVVGINAGSSTDIKGWMYLLKYDTTYGPILTLKIDSETLDAANVQNNQIGNLIIEGKKIPVFSQKDPTLLPWKDLNVDVVIESTGHFKSQDKLQAHLNAGARKVVLSAPAKDEIPTYVLGVNANNYKGENIISNASCTTNCIAPVAKIMVDNFGVEKAMMTTIHGYTSDQRLQDGGHKDYRRARAASQNIIPTSTGATEAAAKTLPELAGIFSGIAVRVPVATGSLADFTFVLKRETTKDEVNSIFKREAQSQNYKGVLEVSEDPIVSSDIIANPNSSIVDLSLTQVSGNLVKVIAWYDNEYGYANRLVEEAIMMGLARDSRSAEEVQRQAENLEPKAQNFPESTESSTFLDQEQVSNQDLVNGINENQQVNNYAQNDIAQAKPEEKDDQPTY